MIAGRWPWVVASALLAARSVRAEPFACPGCAEHLDPREFRSPPPCPTTAAGTRGWIHGSLAIVAPPSFRCEAAEQPVDDPDVLLGKTAAPADPATGCIVVGGMPACDGIDRVDRTTVGIDGVGREVSAAVGLSWKACGLAPGRHAATMCTPRGAVTCEIDVASGSASSQLLVSADAELRVRVDRVYVGDRALVGRELRFRYAVDAGWSGQLALPDQADLVWTGSEPEPSASICPPPRDVAAGLPAVVRHGCAGCAGADSASGVAVIAVVGLLLARRRR